MNETLKQLGLELRRRSQAILRRPMNWRMIDTVVRLEETEEQRARDTKLAQGVIDDDKETDGLIWRAANDRAANDDVKSGDGAKTGDGGERR
jgi:hypothetical protein